MKESINMHYLKYVLNSESYTVYIRTKYELNHIYY